MTPVNIICLKWGTRYPAYYTNNVYLSVAKHLRRSFRFVCVTDDPTGLHPSIDAVPFMPNPDVDGTRNMVEHGWPSVFVKLMITQDGFANLVGPTLFLDVDVLILRDLDSLFDYEPGKNCIIHNWVESHKTWFRSRPDVGNSSVFRFEAGKSNYIYETFIREMDAATNRGVFPTEQAFLTYAMKEKCWWPDEWVVSFKRQCRPAFPFNLFAAPKEPENAKILVFHGNPDPLEVVAGYAGKKRRKIHHRVLPCPWVRKHWLAQWPAHLPEN